MLVQQVVLLYRYRRVAKKFTKTETRTKRHYGVITGLMPKQLLVEALVVALNAAASLGLVEIGSEVSKGWKESSTNVFFQTNAWTEILDADRLADKVLQPTTLVHVFNFEINACTYNTRII